MLELLPGPVLESRRTPEVSLVSIKHKIWLLESGTFPLELHRLVDEATCIHGFVGEWTATVKAYPQQPTTPNQ